MCGIAGTLDRDGPVEPGLVERMCETLAHRGPDSRGVFTDDGVAVGVARLAVIDVDGGDQPIATENGDVVVVCNGEIYNYRELREELSGRGHRFSTRSDTEVIAHLYEELGDACVEPLRGMFAFALWDRRRHRLLLARDRVGKKPLFYAAQGGRLWFASELRAILVDERVPRDLDHAALDLYLHYQSVPAPLSAFAALRKLPPAHTLAWQDGEVSVRRYWSLSYRDREPVPSEEEACERIRETLIEATALRLRSDVPVGAFLSGGVDSSAVVAAMARLTSEPVKTFSIGFDVGDYDETPYAREVAERYGADHHELILDQRAFDQLPRMVWHYGEPFADSSAVATFALAELAARHVTVALNGDGGDESFGGYARHARPPLPNVATERRYAARRAHRYFDEPERAALYTPEFAELVAGNDWRAPVEDIYFACDSEDPRERLLAVDAAMYMPDDLFVKMDVATMAHSLEARSPFCDQQLMELAAALPMSMKVGENDPKALLKRAVRPWLPERAIDRPKVGFAIPMEEWLRRNGVADVLLDPRTLERGLFCGERIETLLSEQRDGVGDHSYQVWSLLVLELWFRTYVDRAAVDAPLELAAA
jgi:asparagine synthase (glutamine-hydrolysing)